MLLFHTIIKFIFSLSIFAGMVRPCTGQIISHIEQVPIQVNPALIGDKGIVRGCLFYSPQWESVKQSFVREKTIAFALEGTLKNVAGGLLVHSVQNSAENGSKFLRLKASIAYFLRLQRKQGTKSYAFIPALGYTNIRTNNSLYADIFLYKDGVEKVNSAINSAREIFTWPAKENGWTAGLAYKSTKTSIAISFQKSAQELDLKKGEIYNMGTRFRYRSSDSLMQIKERSDLETENSAIMNQTKYLWQQQAFSLYFSQKMFLGARKNFSLTFFTWFTNFQRLGMTKILSKSYDSEDALLDAGSTLRYKNFLFGIQIGNRIYDYLLVGYTKNNYTLLLSYASGRSIINGSISLSYTLDKY